MSDDEPQAEPEEGELPSGQATVDAASLKTLRRQRDKRTIEEREGDAFWASVFASPVGRREMWRLLDDDCGLFHANAFACGPNGFPQPEATWFRAGAKDFARRLFDRWEVLDFQGVYMMRVEHDQPTFARAKRPAGKAP